MTLFHAWQMEPLGDRLLIKPEETKKASACFWSLLLAVAYTERY
jgi:hypothetical protein